jgi:hypothetical protein
MGRGSLAPDKDGKPEATWLRVDKDDASKVSFNAGQGSYPMHDDLDWVRRDFYLTVDDVRYILRPHIIGQQKYTTTVQFTLIRAQGAPPALALEESPIQAPRPQLPPEYRYSVCGGSISVHGATLSRHDVSDLSLRVLGHERTSQLIGRMQRHVIQVCGERGPEYCTQVVYCAFHYGINEDIRSMRIVERYAVVFEDYNRLKRGEAPLVLSWRVRVTPAVLLGVATASFTVGLPGRDYPLTNIRSVGKFLLCPIGAVAAVLTSEVVAEWQAIALERRHAPLNPIDPGPRC